MSQETTAAFDLDQALNAYSSQAKSVTSRTAIQTAAYTAAAGAALALAASADAAIQYTAVGQYFPIGTGTGPTFQNGYPIDFNGDTVPDFNIVVQRSASTSQGVLAFGNRMVFDAGYPAQLAAGLSVGPAQVFGSVSTLALAMDIGGATTFYGNWLNSQQGFLGIAVPNAGSTNYAWVRLSISNDISGIPVGFTVADWAYETVADTALMTGAIPEPSPVTGLALLAAGAAGVTAWRRRKQAKTTS